MALEKRVGNLEEEIKKRIPEKNINRLIADAILTLPEDKKNKIVEILKRGEGGNEEENKKLWGKDIKEIATVLAELTEEEREKFYSTFEQKYDW